MKSSMHRSHLVAATYGLIFAFFCGLVSVALQPLPFFVIFFAPLWGVAFYTIPTCLGIVLARGLAKRLGPHDLFTLLAGVLALALSFGFDYASSIRAWLTSRGELHGTVLGPGPPPEDIGGWIVRAASLAVWIGLMIAGGIAWKRAREAQAPPAALTPVEISKLMSWLVFDSIVIGLVLFSILWTDLNQRREWSNPEHVFARAAAVLQEKGASEGDRALALNTIEGFHNDQATEILRLAVREETGETQMSAAAALIGRDDLLALSVLEGPLMQGKMFTGTILPTTSLTPSEGNGVHIAGFGHIGSRNFGASLAGVKNPDAVPILVRLMAAPDAETRRGAASALRNFHSSASTDAMIAGLNDTDEIVRYFSVCTLMELNGNPHYPAVSIFEDDEQSYLDHWKAWAKHREPENPTE